MSSTPTTSVDRPSSRVPSASSKTKEETPIGHTNGTTDKTSRPPSASQRTAADTSRASAIAATGAGISPGAPAAGKEEPILSTVTPSENQQSITDTSTELRPGSASKTASHDTTDRPLSVAKVNLTVNSTTPELKTSRPPSANQNPDELASHGYSIATTNFRPQSASQKADESTTKTSSRPPSASLKADESITKTSSRPPSASLKTDESTTKTSSRPPSASLKADESITKTSSRPPSVSLKADESTTKTSSRPPSASLKADESITKTSSRPPSASLKADESTTKTGSRPPSASLKTDESGTNAPANSRPSTAGQRTEVTNVSEPANNTAPTNSRPSSANQKPDLTTARIGSRPPSANQKQEETTTGDSTAEKQNTSVLFNANEPNIIQPIIGRPPSAAKKVLTEESNTTTSPNTLTEDVPLSDENKPAGATPRIGSASKNPPASTTTENNS
jgi:hypothetical protein